MVDTFEMKLFMKHVVSTISVLLLSLSLSWGDDFQKSFNAYKKGDYAIALEGFKRLAEQGGAAAQYNLAQMFYNGQGTIQDYKEAVKWHTLAAKQGYIHAQFNLAVMLKEGQGTIRDYKEAVRWFKIAAEGGYSKAQNNLGLLYNEGLGVLQDLVYAHMWLNIAAANGFEDASTNRDLVAKNMPPSQIEKAQDLARECVKKNYKGC